MVESAALDVTSSTVGSGSVVVGEEESSGIETGDGASPAGVDEGEHGAAAEEAASWVASATVPAADAEAEVEEEPATVEDEECGLMIDEDEDGTLGADELRPLADVAPW